jgi:type I restriction enzyme S subunit
MAAVSEDGSMQVREHKSGSALSNGYSYFQTGDVLVAKITPCFENNKITVAQIDREHGFGSTEFHVIRPSSSDLDARYLVYFLRQDSVRDLGQKRMTGSAGQRRVPRRFLEQLEIPLPPLDEQRRIAAILDQADALRRKRQEALELLNDLPSKLFSEQFGDLAINELGWPTVPVRHFVFSFQSGKNLVSDDKDDPNAQFRVLKVSAITSLSFKAEQSKALPAHYNPPAQHLVHQGDLIFSRANTSDLIGATAFVDEDVRNLVLPDKLWRFVWYDDDRVEPLFVWFLFRQRGFRDQISRRATGTSGSMKNIPQDKVLDITVGFPPLRSQREFVRKLKEIRSARKGQEIQSRHLDRLFVSLQHRAFRGEL